MSTKGEVSSYKPSLMQADKLFNSNIPELKEQMLYAKNWIKGNGL